jgi:hypothetical protein
MGAVEHVARGAPSTLLAVLSGGGGSARGGITQLAGNAGRAAFEALARAGALASAEAALGGPPVTPVLGPGVHAKTKPTSTPKVTGARARRTDPFTVSSRLGAAGPDVQGSARISEVVVQETR